MHYAITNLFASTSPSPQALATGIRRLEADVARWAAEEVAFVQLREKALTPDSVLFLAKVARTALQGAAEPHRPRLLLNGRPELAIAAGLDGVHLSSSPGNPSPAHIRQLYRRAGLPACTVSASCHTLAEVTQRCEAGVDLLLFGPVFGKTVDGRLVTPAAGFQRLAEACALASSVPVLALGGLTRADEPACLAAGAAGIAGIRLFAQPGAP